jgi:hypothetical protein
MIVIVTVLAIAVTPSVVLGAWERGVWAPCSQCHPTDPKPIPVEAEETLQAMACLNCHSPRFPPATPNASYAHYAHSAVFGFGAGPGDWAKHPRGDEAEKMGKDVGDCIDCHFKVERENCINACHERSMPHVGDRVDCDVCHGSLPSVRTHLTTLPSGTSHEIGIGAGACFACHNPEAIDAFRLASGVVVVYANPPELCYQCHSRVHKKWSQGEHYDGVTSCTDSDCHNPHDPYLAPPTVPVEEEVVPAFPPGLDVALVAIVGVVLITIAVIWVRRRGI